MIDRLIAVTFDGRSTDGYEAEVSRAVQRVVVDRLMGLARQARSSQVRAVATQKLADLAARPAGSGSPDVRAARALTAADIRRFLARPYDPTKLLAPPVAPPGSPIGDLDEEHLP